MQLLSVLIAQLGCIERSLSGIDAGLRLAYLGLVSYVINHKQHLSGANCLTFLHINLSNESSYLRTNLYILYTLDSCRISGLSFRTLSTYSCYRILVVAKLGATTATTA